jgi:hypothetical protein
MKINKSNLNPNKPIFKSKIFLEKNEIKNEINLEPNSSKINNINSESPKNFDLSGPAPNLYNSKIPKKINKDNFHKMFEIGFDEEKYRLYFNINEENNLVIELIPKGGNIPFSFKNTFDEEKFYKINKIFMQFKTVEKIAEKLINLFKKKKIFIGYDKKEEIFYLVLKITIIDEDSDIFIPLFKNDELQICSVKYLLKETDNLKNKFNEYKVETEDIIKYQNEEINKLKKTNLLYLKIIENIKNEYKNENNESLKDYEEEIEIDINDEDEDLEMINDIIVDEDEEIKIMEKKIEFIEHELKIMDDKYKCNISPKYKILNLSINQTKPYIYIYFELLNTGLNSLTSESDDIFCNIEGISENCLSFYNEQEKYIFLTETLLPNNKIIISKKLVLNNPIKNRKYDFCINIYSLNHGKISEEPIKFNIYIREKENQKNFLSFLNNKKFNFNDKNNKQKNKFILEYSNIIDKKNENNFKPIYLKDDINIQNNTNWKIRKFIYDEKSGMALEDKNKEIIINNNKFFEIYIVINRDDVEAIIKNIKNKYNHLKEFETEKLEEIICSCIGDFNTICTFIEKMV